MEIVGLLAWLAAAVGTATALPQLIRIWRTRNTAGISIKLWQLSALGSVAWSSHGFLIGQPAMALSNLVVGLMQACILVFVSRSRGRDPFSILLGPIVVGALLIGVDMLLPTVVFGVFASLAPIGGQLAQLRVMRRARTLSGISAQYLVLNLTAQALWLTYALITVEWATRISSGGLLMLCIVVLGYYVVRTVRSAPDPLPVPVASAPAAAPAPDAVPVGA